MNDDASWDVVSLLLAFDFTTEEAAAGIALRYKSATQAGALVAHVYEPGACDGTMAGKAARLQSSLVAP
jgi:hypothetical protein